MVLISIPIQTSAGAKVLSVPKYDQTKSQWCWVAASQSIIRYYKGTKHGQCSIFKRGKNASSCYNEGGTWTNYKNAFSKAGFRTIGIETSSPVSYSFLATEIQNNRPLIARISWKDSTGKKTGSHHAAPIRGYDDHYYGDKVVYWIHIRNGSTDTSGNSSYRISTYNYMKSNSSFDWTKTKYGFKG